MRKEVCRLEKNKPQTQEEILLYEYWKDALGTDDFGIDDDFFEIGGDSIMAIDVISKLGDKYEVDLKNVFDTATIRAIASGMKLNPNWAEDKLRFIFHKHEEKTVKKQEFLQYRQKISETQMKRLKESKYSSILLLGATGFLGAYLLRELLKKTDCDISLIVRAEDDQKATERVWEFQKFYFGDIQGEDRNRLHIYAGDLTKERFGLPQSEWNKLLGTTDAILNSAAIVKHMGKSNDFIDTNVKTVRTLIKFASDGRPKDIHHVSSIGILFGEQNNIDRTIFTEYDFDIGQKLDNDYLKTKFSAEKLLFEAQKKGANANIYRLNGVLFDSQTGFFQKNIHESSAYIFLRALHQLKMVPQIGTYNVDISMVDQIAEAIVRLMFFSQENNQVYHVMHPQEIRFEKVMRWLTKKDTSFVEMNAEQICNYYRENIENEQVRSAFGDILFYCEIFDSIMQNHCKIERQKTIKNLKKIGFRWKRIRVTHLKKAYAYARETGFM